MTNYIWKAKDKSGNPIVREVWANTLDDSKAILASEGCTELELFQDEIMAAAVSGFDEQPTVLGEKIEVTAAQRVEQVNKPPLTIWSAIRQGVGQTKWFHLAQEYLIATKENELIAECEKALSRAV